MRIIVIRHASTEFNESGLINGRHDDILSAEGRRELPGLVKKLKGMDFTAIYSSPLKRTIETALPIAEDHNIGINIDRRLIEVDFGSFTSKNWNTIKEVAGLDFWELLNTYTYDLRPYGGESAVEVESRVKDFLSDLYKKPDQTVLIVTHGGILRWFYFICKNQKITGQPNSSVHIFDVKI